MPPGAFKPFRTLDPAAGDVASGAENDFCLNPMSREAMRRLKGVADLEIHAKHIEKLIKFFYDKAITKAMTSTETSIQLPGYGLEGYGDFHDPGTGQTIKFTETDKDDLLSGLRSLFPDCLVEYQILVQGNDGKVYDFSKMDKAMLPFINNRQTRECLVIDWS